MTITNSDTVLVKILLYFSLKEIRKRVIIWTCKIYIFGFQYSREISCNKDKKVFLFQGFSFRFG